MKKTQQELLCVLLQTLLERGLITQNAFDATRCRILGSDDFPVFFRNADCDGKEMPDERM